ncbi:MAG: hypothetical protein PVJ76_04365 [Gemmatimonadota bacterium]|jgi:hypothetical protein
MKNVDLHPIPTFRAVLMEQTRVVGPTILILGAIFGTLFALGTLLILFNRPPDPVSFDLNYFNLSVMAVFGVAIPLFLWRGAESPFQAGFPWTLPVERAQHAMARVGAGWIWLIIGVAVFILWQAANTLLSGGALAGSETWLLAAPAGTVEDRMDPAFMTSVVWSQPGWMLAVPFIGATGVYLLTSALFLTTRYPGRWIIGTILGTLILSLITHRAGLQGLDDVAGSVLDSLLGGRYGLSTFVGGGTFEASATRLPSGQEALVWMSLPTFQRWAIAVVLWMPAAFAALGFAVFKHRDGRGGQAESSEGNGFSP